MRPRHDDWRSKLTCRHVEESGRKFGAALVGHAEAVVVAAVREHVRGRNKSEKINSSN